MSEREPRRRRRRVVLALALGCALALGVGELAARAVHGAPLAERTPLLEVRANAKRAWEMVPSCEHYTYLHPVRVNALGLRGPELGEKRVGERRVLVLGDSMVYGQGVAEEDTLPARLERELRASGEDWTAVNGGLRGYNTEQELALLEELAPRIRPDVVLLCWFPNDLEEFDVARMAEGLERSGPVVFDVHARWEGSVVWKWRLKQLARRSALVMVLWHAWSDRHQPEPTPAALEVAFEHLGPQFARFRALGTAHGFRACVAAIPFNVSLRAGGAASETRTQRMRALALEQGLAVLDLLPALRACLADDPRPPILPYDGHYDGRGNACMARALPELVRGQR